MKHSELFVNKFCIWTPSGQRTSYVSMLHIRIDDCHLCLASIAKFLMADFEKNVEEMVGTTRSGGDRVRRGRDGDETEDETGDETATTTGDETAATGGVMYTDEGELEFDENEMAALEEQRLVAEFRCEIVSRFRL